MASCIMNQFCIKCGKSEDIVSCAECPQWFCLQHINEHRQECLTKVDNIEQKHAQNQNNTADPLLHGTLTQNFLWVEEADKCLLLLDVLKNRPDPEALTLVFAGTKRTVDKLHAFLENHQYSVSSIHGGRMKEQRDEAFKAFKTGRTPILITSIIAVRGFYVPNVKCVINFDFPWNTDVYYECIGRIGSVGQAISFFNKGNQSTAADLRKSIRNSHQEVPKWLDDLLRESKNDAYHRLPHEDGRMDSVKNHYEEHEPQQLHVLEGQTVDNISSGYYNVQQDNGNQQQPKKEQSHIWWDISS